MFDSKSSDSCFSAQVDALLTTEASDGLAVTAVMVDSESARNTILDSGSDAQVIADRAVNAFRATPTIGFEAAHALVDQYPAQARRDPRGSPSGPWDE